MIIVIIIVNISVHIHIDATYIYRSSLLLGFSQIRAYTAKDKFSETSWSQPISTDPDNTAILVGITVPVILIIVILLAFVLIRKLHCNACTKSLGHYTDRQADLVSIACLCIILITHLMWRSCELLRALTCSLHT